MFTWAFLLLSLVCISLTAQVCQVKGIFCPLMLVFVLISLIGMIIAYLILSDHWFIFSVLMLHRCCSKLEAKRWMYNHYATIWASMVRSTWFSFGTSWIMKDARNCCMTLASESINWPFLLFSIHLRREKTTNIRDWKKRRYFIVLSMLAVTACDGGRSRGDVII